MSAKRPRRIDRRTAERLLRSGPDDTGGAGPDAVSDLLAAASAPAREGELAGEQAAVAAFRTARLRPVPEPRRRSMVTTSFAKPTTVKIGIAAAAVMVSVGGVAFAFAGGSAPTVERGGPPAQPPALPTPSQLSESPSASQDNPPEGEKGQGNNDNNPSPTPSLKGLCNAYTSGGKHGKALDNPAFNYLILSAGGKEKVAGFCADLLDDKHGRSGPRDKDPGRPSEPHPGDKPKHSQPTERPTP